MRAAKNNGRLTTPNFFWQFFVFFLFRKFKVFQKYQRHIFSL